MASRVLLIISVFFSTITFGQGKNLVFDTVITMTFDHVKSGNNPSDENASFSFQIPDSTVWKITHVSGLRQTSAGYIANSETRAILVDGVVLHDHLNRYSSSINAWFSAGNHTVETVVGNINGSFTVRFGFTAIQYRVIPID